MAEPLYAGLDIGSSGVRALAVTADGRLAAAAARPRPRAPMSLTRVERGLDVDGVWRDCLEVLGALRASGSLAAISAAARRHSLVVQDAADRVIFASGNDDLRASFAGAVVEEAAGGRLLDRTGHAPAMIHWPGKLRWLTDERPDICAAAARLLTLEGWIAWRLGAPPVLTEVSAVETGAWDLTANGWALDLLPDWARAVLPPVDPAPPPSRLSAAAAAALGAGRACLAHAGWPDTHAAELAVRGGGGWDCAAAGWSTTLLRPYPAHAAGARVWQGRRIDAGPVLEANAGDGGTGYTWLDPRGTVSELTMEATSEHSAADAGVFVLCGLRVMDWRSPGMTSAGMFAPLPFAAGEPTAAVLGTAVLEDLGFALRGNRAELDAVQPAGDRLRLTGGYARAPAAARIAANATGCEVYAYPGLAAPAWGAAAAAAGAVHGSPTAAARVMAPAAVRAAPARAAEAAYADHYERWRGLRARLDAFVQDEA